MASSAATSGISDRVHFVEGGKAHKRMDRSLGVVVLNSTMEISAPRQSKPIYCVDTSVYAMPGHSAEMSLDAFWSHPCGPGATTIADFERVLQTHALDNGNFYTQEGISTAIDGTLQRLNERIHRA